MSIDLVASRDCRWLRELMPFRNFVLIRSWRWHLLHEPIRPIGEFEMTVSAQQITRRSPATRYQLPRLEQRSRASWGCRRMLMADAGARTLPGRSS